MCLRIVLYKSLIKIETNGLSCELKRFRAIGCKHLDNVNAMAAIGRKGEHLLALFACGKP